MNVTLRQLRVFLAVAATRNFTRAGEQVGLSQPAVSRSVTELEEQLGIRLLDRTTRDVELTDAGQGFAAQLDGVLDGLNAALMDVRGLAVQRSGRVRVASSPTLSANLMPGCIARCAREHPGIEVLLLDRIQHDALASVLRGEVDFGVVIDPQLNGELHCEEILEEPFCLVVPAGHALAARRSVKWSALSGEGLVLLDHASGSRRLIDAALLREGVQARVVQEVGHPTTIFRMVEAGLGISVVPELALAPGGLGDLKVLALTPRVNRAIVLVRRKHRAMTPLAQLVWGLVKDVARERALSPKPA